MSHDPTRARPDRAATTLTFFMTSALLVSGLFLPSRIAAQGAHAADTLTYIKVLKGSSPEYQAITVDSSGVGTYDGRKLDEAPRIRPLKISAATTRRLFDLAHAMNNFRAIQLESHRKVADLGMKTFIYESGGRQNKVQFNYTLDRRADTLMELFDGIGNVEQHIGSLEFSAKYDRLGLPGELRQIQIDLDNKELVDPELMVPILQKIAENREFLHIAQTRAADILQRIQNSK